MAGSRSKEVSSETCRPWTVMEIGEVEVNGDLGERGSRKDHEEQNVGDDLNGDLSWVVEAGRDGDVMECDAGDLTICVEEKLQQ